MRIDYKATWKNERRKVEILRRALDDIAQPRTQAERNTIARAFKQAGLVPGFTVE